ncbi:MAG: acyl-CoA dehydrogenase family protein [Maricaulaceae bacterium]|nr:acyl-CoA dehydrogenase family protein [Maricaulaceae bacterium]
MTRHLRPRADLPTHTVGNQPEPLGDLNLFAGDAMLSHHVLRALEAAGGREDHAAHLSAYGAEMGRADVRDLGRQANENPPKFIPFDRYGYRVDEVEFHPAYHALMRIGLGAGVSSRAWTHPKGGHAAHSALMALTGWADAGVCCPMSMTYAVVPALQASDWAAAEWAPRVTAANYDPRFIPAADKTAATMGMAMTEKQGGSDVRANETRAHGANADGEVELTGHKWFCSAPMSDAFLTLAYEDEGLSCFLAPRWRPDGSRNVIEIQRLKDKMGDRSNASSEIEYRGAYARRVGEPGRGVRTIIEMVQHTRLDCLTGAAGGMRIGAALAVHHADGRSAFQKRLIDQPLMRAVLADLALEAEAALALAWRVCESFDRTGENPAEAALARILTPIAKYWLCKRAPMHAAEVMECHGGVGFVEESDIPRLFRQSPLNGIWEGSGNVIALDIRRALSAPEAVEALRAEAESGRGLHPALDQLLDEVLAQASAGGGAEVSARRFAERAGIAFSACALARAGLDSAAGDFITRRIVSPALAFGAGGGEIDATALIERARLRR